MTSTLNAQLDHFSVSARGYLVSAGEALVNGDWADLKVHAARISELKVVQQIANLLNTAGDAMAAFVERLKSAFAESALLRGGVMAGVGGGMLAEAAGLAAALGISVLGVQVIAVLLILWGLSIVLPYLWSKAVKKMDTFNLSDFND